MVEIWSKSLQDLVDDAQSEIKQFYLSYKYDRIRDEYSDALSDMWQSYYYMQRAGDAMDSFDYTTATTYITLSTQYTTSSAEHISETTRLINDLN